MWKPGIWEIIIVLIIVILLFGPGRIAKVSKELGSSITAFKEGLGGKEKKSEDNSSDKEKAAATEKTETSDSHKSE